MQEDTVCRHHRRLGQSGGAYFINVAWPEISDAGRHPLGSPVLIVVVVDFVLGGVRALSPVPPTLDGD